MTETEMILKGLDEFKKEFKELREIIVGNGHIENSISYRLKQTEETQKNCPIKEVAEIYKKLKQYGMAVILSVSFISGLITFVVEIFIKK